jgi:hypothetical protein
MHNPNTGHVYIQVPDAVATPEVLAAPPAVLAAPPAVPRPRVVNSATNPAEYMRLNRLVKTMSCPPLILAAYKKGGPDRGKALSTFIESGCDAEACEAKMHRELELTRELHMEGQYFFEREALACLHVFVSHGCALA